MNSKHEMNMTNGPLAGKIAAFALPLVLSGMLQLFYNAADMVVVGQFSGHRSLAAVSATSSLISLFINFFTGLAVGTNVALSQYIGARNQKDTFETVHTSIAVAIAFGFILMFASFGFVKPFLRLMNTPDDVFHLSATYLQIYFLGSPANLLYNYGSAVMRTTGDTKRPLYFLTVSGIINIILNLILVIIFKLDTTGVAIATVISQYVSAALVMITLVRSSGTCAVIPKSIRIYPKKLIQLIRLGLPAGMQGVMFSVSNIVIQSSVNSFGSLAMSGSGATSNVESFTYIGMNAFAQTALVFTGQNYGAGKTKRILKSTLLCALMAVGAWALIAAATILFDKQLLAIFIPNNPEAMDYAVMRLKIIIYPYFLLAISDCFSNSLIGLGKSIQTATVCMVCICGLRLAWIFTAFKKHHTFKCLFLSYPLSWLAALVIMIIYFTVTYRKLKKERTAQ